MVTGFPALDHDVRAISAEDTERGEQRALPPTLAVLIVAFGALVAAALPVLVGVVAITLGLGLVTLAARYTPMSVFVLNITTMVGLGVGIAYSLLIVTRFREELNRGLSPADAAIRTMETAGSAVITSGLTVVVGFSALLTTPLSDTRSVGVGGLLVVLVAVLLATTFLPATFAILGRNIDRPRWLARPLARFHAPTGWERWARWLGHRPWRAVAVGGAAIALLTFPATQIRLGLPATNWFPPESESGQGLQALREMGASGVIQPVRVVVQLPEGESALSGRRLPGLKALTDSIRKDPPVREVRGLRAHGPGVPARLRRRRVRPRGPNAGDLGRRARARVRDRVRPVDGLRGVSAHPRERGVRQDGPERPRHHGGPVRDRVHHHERGAHHDPGVRHVRVRARARRATDRLRPGGRRAARRDADPGGARAC